MPKSLVITPHIASQIRAGVGDDNLDVSNFAVFEAVFLSTKPLNKRGSIFQGARVSRATLSEMAW